MSDKDYFKKEQIKFLIDLLSLHTQPISEVLYDSENQIKKDEEIIKECMKWIKDILKYNKHITIDELFNDGVKVLLDYGDDENADETEQQKLKSKLFLSFLLSEEEKQKLSKEIIKHYLNYNKESKKEDFKKDLSDGDLLDLLD